MKRLVSMAVLLVPSLLFAQGQTQEEFVAQLLERWHDLQKRHSTTIRGSENPTGLPRGHALRGFFLELASEAPADDVAFRKFTSDRFGATESDSEVLREAYENLDAGTDDICARVLDGSLADGMSIAEHIAQVEERSDRRADARYQAIVDRLSPTARARVLRGVEEVALGTTSVTLDHVGMASDDPHLYATMIRGACRAQSRPSSGDSQAERSEESPQAQLP